jgi:hypothetical protein
MAERIGLSKFTPRDFLRCGHAAGRPEAAVPDSTRGAIGAGGAGYGLPRPAWHDRFNAK